jgi:hypothetical protein
MVANTYSEAILKIYNPQRDSMTLKANPEDFRSKEDIILSEENRMLTV